MNIEQAKQYSIVDYLAWKGHKPFSYRGQEILYLSPFRTETKPSFSVNPEKNVWADFGEQPIHSRDKICGGQIHTLAALLCGSMSNGLADIAKFAGVNHHPSNCIITQDRKLTRQPGHIVHNYKSIEKPELISYLSSRGISRNVAQSYCHEVWYSNPNSQDPTKRYYAVGLSNISGGWDIRAKGFKSAIAPKDVSIINNGSEHAMVFEGFVNMLTYMTYLEVLGTKEKIKGLDWICLNSAVNALSAIPHLKAYRDIRLYFDNDKSGNDATQTIIKDYPQAVDCRKAYWGWNDINDWWVDFNHLKSK